ncbi:MAG: 3-oxoacyl-[acyl-carrier-protein] reductase [Elusimicrobia bacterium]|nr:3-oxoacyl-[acyl-carrier-protein] reductase [Elusimicrobiota bacterium]MDE2237294.1 3-oxoacyl-[acyl-carrier-protein] reductase [Elusimicrobiota bacterium]MDE2427061.1 3-oxoacyl-[acyl-carrier-protein] reductase [Elusimicrobiota bacterium]
MKDRAAIITGAAQGIGLATAELFAAEGAAVMLVDVDEARAAQAAAGLARSGARALEARADVSKLADCEAVVARALEAFGRLDILVNNAGITKDNLLLRMSEADWDLVLGVNLRGAFNFTKAALRPMLKAHYGRIVNIASIVGEEGNAGQANYAASKGGIIALTKSCARELATRNILCNAVAPGFIRTRLTEAIPEAEKQKLLTKILVGRMGEPIDVARAILFLASEDSSYVTGHVLNVNGGGYM